MVTCIRYHSHPLGFPCPWEWPRGCQNDANAILTNFLRENMRLGCTGEGKVNGIACLCFDFLLQYYQGAHDIRTLHGYYQSHRSLCTRSGVIRDNQSVLTSVTCLNLAPNSPAPPPNSSLRRAAIWVLTLGDDEKC